MYTAQDVREMDIDEIVKLIKLKTGRPVTASTGVFLAMAHGSQRGGGDGVHVIDLGRGQSGTRGIDYEEMAELFNGPDIPKEPRPEFTVRIPNPDHFLEAYDEAGKVGGEVFEKFKGEILTLILWAMREYRDTLTVYPDFCEHSFYWTMSQDGRVCFNGGLIKHGEGEDAYWSVHT